MGFREFANCGEEANLLLPLRIQKLKGFQLQGDLVFLTRGSAPGPRGGSTIGSCSAFAICIHPTYFDLATPLCVRVCQKSVFY